MIFLELAESFKTMKPEIASEKLHQNQSDYIQFLFIERFEVDKKKLFLVKKWEIKVITSERSERSSY